MSDVARKRAVRNYRDRLGQRGIARFEVTAPESDRALLRAVARRLAGDGPEAERARAALRRAVAGEPPATGGILEALRRSPLVGADLDLTRAREEGREVDL